ncbi:MAG TPA: hypothetical protein VGM43_05365, partial [Bryobacteraceae bacterium]
MKRHPGVVQKILEFGGDFYEAAARSSLPVACPSWYDRVDTYRPLQTAGPSTPFNWGDSAGPATACRYSVALFGAREYLHPLFRKKGRLNRFAKHQQGDKPDYQE